jgi:succinoglycan biosynthesis protein ExoO
MTQCRPIAAPDGRSPLISVVMANYCGATHLPAALNSVLGQTIRDIEVIVSDDASPDNSCDVVQRFAQHDPRVRLISARKNGGPAAARNRALEVAKGEWIAIVDSDDVIDSKRFEILLATASGLDADAVADDLQFFAEDSGGDGATLLGKNVSTDPWQVSTEFFIRSNTDGSGLPALGYLKPVFRRSKIASIRYDESTHVGEDYDFLLRFLLDGGRLFLLPEPLYSYRRHAASISHRLSEDKVLRMIAGQDALVTKRETLPPHIRDLLDGRMKALRRALAFERLVASLKAGRLRDAIVRLAVEPRLCAPLARSASQHLHARLSSPHRGHRIH